MHLEEKSQRIEDQLTIKHGKLEFQKNIQKLKRSSELEKKLDILTQGFWQSLED